MIEKNPDQIESEDTAGSSMHWSDAEVKHDITPVGGKADADTDEPDDTEGSGVRLH